MTDERLKLYMANYIAAIEETRRKLREHDARRRRAKDISEATLKDVERRRSTWNAD